MFGHCWIAWANVHKDTLCPNVRLFLSLSNNIDQNQPALLWSQILGNRFASIDQILAYYIKRHARTVGERSRGLKKFIDNRVDCILDTIVKVVLTNNRDWFWYKHSAEDGRSSVIWEGMRVSMGQKQHLESAHMCYGRINAKWIRILQRKIFIFFIMCSSFYHSFSFSSPSSTSYSSSVTTLYCYLIYAITSMYKY